VDILFTDLYLTTYKLYFTDLFKKKEDIPWMKQSVIAIIIQQVIWRRMLLNMADPPLWSRSLLNQKPGTVTARPTTPKAADVLRMFARW